MEEGRGRRSEGMRQMTLHRRCRLTTRKWEEAGRTREGGEGAGAVRGGLVHLDFWIIQDKFRFISEKNEEILRILNAVNNEGV